MAKKKTVDMSMPAEEKTVAKPATKKKAKKVATAEVMEAVENTESTAPLSDNAEQSEKKPKKPAHMRSKRYIQARSFVDKTSTYAVDEAIALVRKTSYAKFPGSVEAHLVIRGESLQVEVTFPHTTGKIATVAIADDELLNEIEKGVIKFTTLVAHPSMMPKLAKLAKILGPKGLMPNPKNGTLTPNPEKRKKELEAGSTTLKTEKKAPLMHVLLGKMTQTDKELGENLRALFASFPSGKLVRCTISSSMGPGVKVAI